ncbi:hypothetical protein ACK33C_02585 [Aeromonas hydrophila]|uniref:hypothetical protein n=1 Tax=Aeromonas hydrophila TaxID=644 RepID=UPI0039875C59
MNSNVRAQAITLSSQASQLANEMASVEKLSQMFDLIDKFSKDPSLLDRFKQDPEAIVRQHLPNFQIERSHFHTVDENNNYFPAEGGAAAQIMSGKVAPDSPWMRIEIRAGVGPLCWLNCGICDNKS